MSAGQVNVQIATDMTVASISGAVALAITGTSNDAALAIMPINIGQGAVIVAVARS